MKTEQIEISEEGFKLIKSFHPEFQRAQGIRTNKYIIDCNSIIPVVIEIEEMGFNFIINQFYATVRPFSYMGSFPVIGKMGDTKLQSVTIVVVEFIKWYNTQKT